MNAKHVTYLIFQLCHFDAETFFFWKRAIEHSSRGASGNNNNNNSNKWRADNNTAT